MRFGIRLRDRATEASALSAAYSRNIDFKSRLRDENADVNKAYQIGINFRSPNGPAGRYQTNQPRHGGNARIYGFAGVPGD
jgi:hypothetical protein